MNQLHYVSELEQQAIGLIDTKRPATFLGVDGSGQQYLFSLLANRTRDTIHDVTVCCIDLSSTNGEDAATAIVLHKALRVISAKFNSESLPNLITAIEQFIQDKPLALLINIPYDEPLNKEFWTSTVQIFNRHRWRFNLIIFTSPKVLSDPILTNTAVYKRFTSNIIPIHTNSKEDTLLLISSLEEASSLTIPKKIKDTIVALSGGHPGLTKELVQRYRNSQTEESLSYMNSPINQRITRLLDSLRNDERFELFQLTKNNVKVDSSSLLYTLGLLSDNGTITASLIHDFVLHSDYDVDHNLPNTTSLTKSERALYALFENAPNTIVSRDDIAQAVWQDNTDEKYSDWAIDQLIYSLRKKIATLELHGTITTKRNEGYVYAPTKG